MLRTFWRYLLRGSDELRMHKAWLADTDKLKCYEAYTRRQLQQGSVVKDVAAMRRDAFWKLIAEKAQPREDVGERLIRFRARRG